VSVVYGEDHIVFVFFRIPFPYVVITSADVCVYESTFNVPAEFPCPLTLVFHDELV
jgi:hypothetical protein